MSNLNSRVFSREYIENKKNIVYTNQSTLLNIYCMLAYCDTIINEVNVRLQHRHNITSGLDIHRLLTNIRLIYLIYETLCFDVIPDCLYLYV